VNLAKLRETWSGLETRSQLTLVGSVLAVLIALYMVHSFASKPSYSTLATGLDPATTGQAEKALASAGVTYRIDSGGTSISVLSGEESQARVALAEKGVLNSGHVGFEIFDKSSLSATDFQQQVDYQRALEGEIAMTIEQIQGVSSADVQLVLPTDNLFADKQTKPTAAVLVNGGSSLDATTIRGIAHLVSSSVKGLDVQNVTITDETGTLLWPNGDGGGATADTKLQADNLYASQLAGQINALLTSTLGPNKATARVHADLNVDQTTVAKVTYAKTGTPLTTNKDTETLQSKGGGAAALPSGTNANTTPSYAAGAVSGSGGQSKYNHTTGSTQYGVDKEIQRSVVAPGSVNRLDVALIVDKSVPKAEVTSIQKSVASLAGITPSRGDTLAVSQVTMAPQTTPATQAKPSPIAVIMTNPLGMARNVLLALAAIVFLFMIRRALKRREGEASVPEPTWLRELESGLTVAELEAMPARRALPPSPAIDDPAHQALRTQVEEIVNRQPQAVANQVSAWMKE
jgi:flagellar M-ring protein FliF